MIKRKFKSFDDKEVSYLFFESKRSKSKKNVLIIHGMMEHTERYSEFSEFLSNNGHNVYVLDLRGHDDFRINNKAATFSKGEGVDAIIEDMKILIEKEMQELPVIFGHSFGTSVSLEYAIRNNEIDRLILSAPIYMGGFGKFFGRIVAGIEGIFIKNGKSVLNGVFKSYNKHFKPNRTKNDWLSRDESAVDKYTNDPNCGFGATPRFFSEFIKSTKYMNKNENKINRYTKILVVYGTKDPATGNGKSVERLRKKIRSIDRKINIVENKEGRHESLNEINKYEIYDSILEWLNKLPELG